MKPPSPQLLRVLRHSLLPRASTSTPSCRIPMSRAFSRVAQTQASKPLNPKLQTHDRGPPSKEDTQTDFREMDIYSNTVPPATIIDACLSDGFHLNNGLKLTGGDGILLLGGEAFRWRPWGAVRGSQAEKIDNLLATTGAIDLSSAQMFGLLSIIHPLPDLLIIGTGAMTRPITKKTRELLSSLGVKVDIMDTRNAAASFNLLSTERGTEGVAAAMIPVGWKGR